METTKSGCAAADGDMITLTCSDSELAIKTSLAFLQERSAFFKGLSSFYCKPSLGISFEADIVPFDILTTLMTCLTQDTDPPDCTSTPGKFSRLVIAADYLQMEGVLLIFYRQLMAHLHRQDPTCIAKETLCMYLRVAPLMEQLVKRNSLATPKKLTLYHNGERYLCLCSVVTFLAVGFDQVMYHRLMLSMEFTLFRSTVGSNMQVVSDLQVIQAIKMWINHDPEDRMQHLDSLLRMVRYDPEVPIKYILQLTCVCDGGLCDCINHKDFVISWMAKRSGCSLPTAFKFNTSPAFKGTWTKHCPK